MKSHEDRAIEHYLALIKADHEGAVADPISTAQEAWRLADSESHFISGPSKADLEFLDAAFKIACESERHGKLLPAEAPLATQARARRLH